MNTSDYEFLSGFLMNSSGLALGPGKEYLLESRLVPLAQSLGLADFDGLVSALRRGADKNLSQAVTEAMTTNLVLPRQDSVRRTQIDPAASVGAGSSGLSQTQNLVCRFVHRSRALLPGDAHQRVFPFGR
jgi:hypothetical protein